ncbi:5-bromo-4-chloroindolyl phosphate hydrolysis family protein [Clostridium sp. C2-6-12]|uniref:5-bromo-4-chloroindolyl phosphate hydrolysis family protein n=1 Tax=Clostridium sp. C2-6-12 TaxID=2698832 RepID=UPI00136EC6A9|nr:5-bromo-4-chloroindolyl phosphate hydrolysis family protein [Clostridium sp. C2-6-12]
MGKKDFSDLEDQIRDTVKNAFNAIDFAGIKEEFNNRADDTLNEVKSKMKYKSDDVVEKMKNKSQKFSEKMESKLQKQNEKLLNITKREKNKYSPYITKRPVGSVAGVFYKIFGYSGSAVFALLLGISSISTLIPNPVTSNFTGYIYPTLGIFGSFFLFNLGLSFRGVYLRNRIKRFKEYVKTLDGQNYVLIESLAEAVQKKDKYVIKDLKKMIELNMFKEAHIDEEKTYFMLSNEVYNNYLESQEALKKRTEEELRKQEKSNAEMNDPQKRELRFTIDMGQNYIKQIRDINDALPEEEISNKLYRLENIVSQILEHIENNPKKLPEVNKFTNHYLPITLKLVTSYKELNDQPVQGENITNAKNEIEKSIDFINTAFEKLLDDLFEEVALDISTDISVLETLFTQEGLTKKDFEK